MVRLLKLFAYFSFFIMATIYFLPKNNFYYYLENELQAKKVVISDELLRDNGFSLNIQNPSIHYDSIEVSKVDEINVTMFLVYNSIKIENVKLSTMASTFLPLNIQTIDASYNIFNPQVIQAQALGEFGTADISINLMDREINIKMLVSKLMLTKYKSTLKSLNKNDKGEYIYVKNF